MSERNKRIFLSDLHISHIPKLKAGKHDYTWLQKTDAEALVNFLKHLTSRQDVEEVIFIGDLFDNWVVPVDIEPPSIDDIIAVQVDWEVNAASVYTRNGLVDLEEKMAHRTKTTGCGSGTVFGDLMADIDNIKLPPAAGGVHLAQSTLYSLAELVRRHETIYKQAGAVHGCALFSTQPELLYFVEDVGRHNAVDAIAGMMWLDGVGGADKIFYTTGRLTSEMVIKAAQMGVPFLVSRSGLTQMGYEIAKQVGMTMIGRAVNRHFLLFNDPGRFVFDLTASSEP